MLILLHFMAFATAMEEGTGSKKRKRAPKGTFESVIQEALNNNSTECLKKFMQNKENITISKRDYFELAGLVSTTLKERKTAIEFWEICCHKGHDTFVKSIIYYMTENKKLKIN